MIRTIVSDIPIVMYGIVLGILIIRFMSWIKH